MLFKRCAPTLLGLCLFIAAQGRAAEISVSWPAGWTVEALPLAQASAAQVSVQVRQRAVKNDQAGNPSMVMELTQTQLTPGHEVNVEAVLMEMRKSIQVDFARSGLQSVCTHIRETRLSVVPALETTCTITQNGVHVMTQTLVAAAAKDMAWSLSYAGSAQGYAASREEIMAIRDGLTLKGVP